MLGKEYKKRGREKPFEEPTEEGAYTLSDLSLEAKVQILFDLCEFHLENINNMYDNLLRGYDLGIYWVCVNIITCLYSLAIGSTWEGL